MLGIVGTSSTQCPCLHVCKFVSKLLLYSKLTCLLICTCVTINLCEFTSQSFFCNNCAGLDTPGIYRISGIKSKIEALKNSYNSGRGVDLKEYDVTVVTGLLKQYLRELPESVLTQELNSRFEEASGNYTKLS